MVVKQLIQPFDMRFLRQGLTGMALVLIVSFANGQSYPDRGGTNYTPTPSQVAGVANPVISLNGLWNINIKSPGGTSNHSNLLPESRTIQVPGEWEMQGYKVNEGETAVYSRIFSLPTDWKNHRIQLRFDGVSSHAVVKINGQVVSEHEGGFVPFEADITSALKPSDNLLEVAVQALTISDKLACISQYAAHTVGGILRKVTLFAVPQSHIKNLVAVSSFDNQYKNATLELSMVVNGTASVEYTLRNREGKIVKKHSVNGGTTTSLISVSKPYPWNPESPYLYELTASLKQNGRIIEEIKQKIGFRDVKVKDGRVYVNGRAIKLRGVNRHSVHPLTGRSISVALEVQDAVLFRAANCNFIRTSHYPPTEEFLNACDSLGLFVESESSLCWIQHHASPVWKKWNYKDERFLPYMLRANIEKMVASHNHPSIILWSLGNESHWSKLWEKVNAEVKRLDPTRPTVFHDQCWGSFNNGGSTADIANYHYPGVNGGRATDTMSHPVLFGEYAHLPTYNRRELLTDPGQRGFYGEPLMKMYDSMYCYPKCLGGAVWSGIDDIFHMPDGRLVGYGPWGPIDGWRREKPEYFGMKKAYNPVKIVRADWSVKDKGYLLLHVENRYDFTSLKDVQIIAAFDDEAPQLVQADLPAHEKGVIKIPLKLGAGWLRLRFTDPRGFVVNEEHYDLQPGAWFVQPPLSYFKRSFRENGAAVEVTQGDVTFLISKSTGIITSITQNGKLLISQGPVFSIIPRNSEDGGKSNVAGETYQNDIYPLKGYPLYTIFANNIIAKEGADSLSVTMESNFSDGSKARLVYTFLMNRLKVDYQIDYQGNMEVPYQYGMLMQLPKYMDRLSWDRKGEFTGYPNYDIAREKGTALLAAQSTTEVEVRDVMPSGYWKDDATAMGSNDFRSTKRNIYAASLSDNAGSRITALGKGIQASRSWLQDEKIHWLVADYCNNGSEPFYATPFTDGRINIKGKTLKGGVVLEF